MVVDGMVAVGGVNCWFGGKGGGIVCRRRGGGDVGLGGAGKNKKGDLAIAIAIALLMKANSAGVSPEGLLSWLPSDVVRRKRYRQRRLLKNRGVYRVKCQERGRFHGEQRIRGWWGARCRSLGLTEGNP